MLIVGWLWSFDTAAQPIFDTLKVSDGLSKKNVLCIYKDSDGFYWFGTSNGLNRYDASGMKVYNKANLNAKGLDSDTIQAISEDINGNLWIGTNEGAYQFDKANQTFKKISFDHAQLQTNVTGILQDGSNKIWVFTLNSGNYSWNAIEQRLVRFDDFHQTPLLSRGWAYLIEIGLFLGFGWVLLKRWQRQRQRKEIQDMVDYFTTSRYSTQSVDEILWDITRNCISRLHFEDCVIYLLEEERNVLVQKAAFGPKNPKEFEIANPIEIPIGKGIVGTVAKTGRAEIVNDTSRDTRYIFDDQVRLSELAVPILYGQKVIGVIDSEHPKRNFYTNEHLNALVTIASISASRIEEIKAKLQVAEKEHKLLEFNKLLAESRLMVLRAQMNPHFIFNCLNSIQECVVSERYMDAYQYLQKFSRLLRLVVQNTDRNAIPLSEEIEMITLYLELEKLRFAAGFWFQITCDDDIDTENTDIPPMLLQPFVENALWHGLLPKPDNRQLKIDFRLKEDTILVCSIDDNGIGRKQSAAQKQRQIATQKHQSKGIQITQDRIKLLNKQNQYAHLEIIDNEDSNGNPLGTTVRLALSID